MGKLNRSPFRCRNCKHRFYVYVAPERDEVEETEETEDTVGTDAEAAEPKAEAAHNHDAL